MNKIFKTYTWIVSLFLTVLCSCTNDVESNIQYLRQIDEVSVDGTSNTTVINYSGNKITSIDDAKKRSSFLYTANLITKIEELDKVNSRTVTLQFTYTNNNLTRISSSDNYVLNYIHNADGTVSYEKLTKDSNNNDVKVLHGILYFQSENLIKNDIIFDNAGANVISKKTITYDYDYKINSLRNIIGFSKLLNYDKSISINNNIRSIETTEVKYLSTNQITSSINIYKKEYTYDTNGYPKEIISEKEFLGNGESSKHLKTVLIHN